MGNNSGTPGGGAARPVVCPSTIPARIVEIEPVGTVEQHRDKTGAKRDDNRISV